MNTALSFTIKDVVEYLNHEIPLSLQEGYDNSGLQVGNVEDTLTGILLAVDITEEVIQEAIDQSCNLIVTHHPMLFHGLKQIAGKSYIERSVQLALQYRISIYAAHTNLDNLSSGVNHYFAQMLGLKNTEVLDPIKELLYKVIIYTPHSDANNLRTVLLNNGIGAQGDYDGCSFSIEGEGRFRALQNAHPHVGKINEWHMEQETAIFTMCHKHQLSSILSKIKAAHPYEEPVIDVIPLHDQDKHTGGGIIGDLDHPCDIHQLFDQLKTWMPIKVIAHSKILKPTISRVAFCGGSGAFMRRLAAGKGADIFITGEAKYNDYYDAMDDVTLATIGHYESEELTKSLLHSILCRKIPKFALYYAASCKNPINYII